MGVNNLWSWLRGRFWLGGKKRSTPFGYVRIIGDGTPLGTRVKDENGKDILGAYRVEYESHIGEIPRATIFCHYTEIDVITKAEIVSLCPRCKESIAGGWGNKK